MNDSHSEGDQIAASCFAPFTTLVLGWPHRLDTFYRCYHSAMYTNLSNPEKVFKRKGNCSCFKTYYNAFSNMSDTSLLKLNQGLVLSE